MRIGMILDKTFPPDPRVENEAISLVESGFEVYLFCVKYNKNEAYDEVLNGIKVRRYQSNTLEYKLSALAYTFPFYRNRMVKKISHFLQENTIESIHIHDIRIAGAAFKAAKGLSLPIVLDLHDNMPEIMKFYPHVKKFPGKFLISTKEWKRKEEEFIQKADKIITVSDEFKEEVVERTKISRSKISVVPNTVRRSFYEEAVIDDTILDSYKDNFVLLYLGDTGLRRGLLTAIEAVVELKQTISNIKLVIVGSNTTDSVLRQCAKSLGVEKYIDFQGWQDVALFPSYITASSICISPLDRNIQHDVAFANKLFQYMSFARPVLVSNATAQKNLVERTKTGLVHNEKDPKGFSEKVIRLYNDEVLRNTLGENGKKFIEDEFCWERTSQHLIEIYQNISS